MKFRAWATLEGPGGDDIRPGVDARLCFSAEVEAIANAAYPRLSIHANRAEPLGARVARPQQHREGIGTSAVGGDQCR